MGALIDAAIETDDWDALHDHVEDALALFEPSEPLEHVRFRADFVGVREPEPTQLAKWCTPGWLRWCELELAYVLDRYELGRRHRDGLRVAVHLLRRFGARSPIVEELAGLQVAEHIYRYRWLATALSNNRVPGNSPALAVDEVVTWIEQVKPPILSFADWFALRTVPEDLVEATWYSGVSSRVGESCLDRLDDPELD